MKRTEIAQTLKAVNLIRKEKQPPLASYCILLALGTATEPMTTGDICDLVGETTFGGGTLDRLAEKKLITITKVSKGRYTYQLTQKGFDEVRRIVEGRKNPTAIELRRAAILANVS